MAAITLGSVAALRKTALPARKSLLARAWSAFMQSRMRQAEREIARHQHLLPGQFQLAGERLARNEKDLPFVR